MKIPDRLQHLPTDRRGLPVPWVNLWGGFDEAATAERFRIDRDPHVRAQALFLDDDGDVPNFRRQHYARQRQAMAEGLCQVCGRPVPWSRRYLVIADMSAKAHHVTGLGMAVLVSEPWLDERCARIALDHCPALIRRERDEHLILLPITSRRDVVLTTSVGTVDGPLAEESARVMPVMFVKAAIALAALPRPVQ